MTQLLLICPNCRRMVEADDNVRRWRACSPECRHQWLTGHDSAIGSPPEAVVETPPKRIGRRRHISDEAARSIYFGDGTHKEIAERHNVSRAIVSAIKRGKAYADVTGANEPILYRALTGQKQSAQ